MAGLVQEDAMPIHHDSASNTSQPTTDAANTQQSWSTSPSSVSHPDEGVQLKTEVNGSPQRLVHSHHDADAIEGLRALSQSNGSRSPSTSQRTPSPIKSPTNYHAGHKRTATGEIKSPLLNGAFSPRKGHSRHSSTLSNGSTVTELSQQLRTRLSYAMIKVENGWQSKNLDEIETIASQHASPHSTLVDGSSARHSWQSPRAEMAARLQRQWSDSNSSSDDPTIAAHSKDQTTPTRHSHAALQRSLAAPPDLNQSNPKHRSHASNSLSRYTDTKGLSVAIPSTPPPRRTAHPVKTQRTPSQTAAMEKDALEGLMFMSSPGNTTSTYQFPSQASQTSSTLQTSPLRATFRPSDMQANPRERGIERVRNRSQDLDRILDEMSSTSESEDNEEAAAYLRSNGLGSLAAGA